MGISGQGLDKVDSGFFQGTSKLRILLRQTSNREAGNLKIESKEQYHMGI